MRDLLLVMVFGVVTIPTFVMPHIGVLVWVWIAIMNPHRESFGFSLSLPFNMLIAVLTLGAWVFSGERKRIPFNSVTILLVLFTIWMAFTTYVGVNPGYSWPMLDRNLKTMLLVLAILGLINSRNRIHALVWIMAISIAYWSVRGAMFMAITGGNYKLFGPQGSMITDNNHLAAAFLMMFPLLNYLRNYSAQKLVKQALAGAMGMTLMAVLGSYSRGALIGLAATLPFFWWRSKSKILSLVVLSGIAVGGLAAMPPQFFERMETIKSAEDDHSFQSRLDAWQTAINIGREHPLTGIGFSTTTLGEVYLRYNPETIRNRGLMMHSIYFQALADQGYVGLGLFLAIAFFSWRNARYVIRATKKIPELQWARELASMVMVSLVAYLVAGAALSLTYYDYYYCLVALLIVLRDVVARELKAREPSRRFGDAMASPVPSLAR